MKPIPRKLLIHYAELKNAERDLWQNETLTTVSEMKYIRFESASRLVTNKQNRQITLTATMIYDCRNSIPKGVCFSQGQKVVFNGQTYTVELIEPLYDGRKLHHYELELV